MKVPIFFSRKSKKIQMDFYVDAVNGNDGNSGGSPNDAWQTLTQVNTHVMEPGDSFYFKAGQTFTGRLKYATTVNGAHTAADFEAAPLYFGTYDGTERAILDASTGGSQTGGTIDLLTTAARASARFENLELVGDNGADTGTKMGVRASLFLLGGDLVTVFKGLQFVNLYIHGFSDSWGIQLLADPNNPYAFEDVLVKNCLVEACFGGIRIVRFVISNDGVYHTNIQFVGNSVNGCDDRGLWQYQCQDCVIAANTVTGTTGTSGVSVTNSSRMVVQDNTVVGLFAGITSGINVGSSQNVIVQYNTSVENGGGFVKIGGNTCEHNCYRYNVSINDGYPESTPLQNTIALQGSNVVGEADGIHFTYIYNNTIYTNSKFAGTFFTSADVHGYLCQNNVFYLSRAGVWEPTEGFMDARFENNLDYLAHVPPSAFTSVSETVSDVDPLFYGTGSKIPRAYVSTVYDKLPLSQPVLLMDEDMDGLSAGFQVAEDILGNTLVPGNSQRVGAFHVAHDVKVRSQGSVKVAILTGEVEQYLGVPAGAPLTLGISLAPDFGTITFSTDGLLVYHAPASNMTRLDMCQYKVTYQTRTYVGLVMFHVDASMLSSTEIAIFICGMVLAMLLVVGVALIK